ncbi:MAG: citrate lyase subunit beta/citryl-CoA lyase [Burkholderiaceae bacterium]|jgi:citrate lyase subunit beta/citryl-CoA lyase
MIRSWLFVPGDQARKIDKAFSSGADALIFDWEDAVAPANKQAARSVLSAALAARAAWPAEKPLVFIRINGWDTTFIDDDLIALPVAHIHGVVLPKSCGPADVVRLGERLRGLEQAAGVAQGTLQIVAVATETAASVLALTDFRLPVPGLAGLMWGAEDLAADLGVFRNRDAAGTYRAPFLLARNLTVLAAAAAGTLAIDAVYTDFRDLAGFRAECQAARDDGFQAKAAIHPDQVAIINAVFSGTADEQAWARRVIAAFEAGDGVAVLDGKMIDVPHWRLARRLLGEGR